MKQRPYQPQKSARKINHFAPVFPTQASMMSHGWYRRVMTNAEFENML